MSHSVFILPKCINLALYHKLCVLCPNVSVLSLLYSVSTLPIHYCISFCSVSSSVFTPPKCIKFCPWSHTVYSGQMHKTLLSTLPKNGSNFALCRQTCLLCPSVSRAGPLMRGFVCACSCGCNDQPGHFLDQLQKTCRLPRS